MFLLAGSPVLRANSIGWQGGTGNYSNPALWVCASCGPTFPNNGNLGLTFDGSINSGTVDLVNLDVSGVTVNTMKVGGSGPAASSTLRVTGGNSITFGNASVVSGKVLTIGNGGILNVANGSATLELSAGDGVQVASGGQVQIRDGGSLIVRNTSGNTSTLTDSGSMSVSGAVSNAALVLADGGAGSSFTLSGGGTLTLAGRATLSGQSGFESLRNALGHTITGAGTISNLAGISNSGTLVANGNLTLNLISPAGTRQFSNDGTVNVTDGSALRLIAHGTATIANTSGSINLNGTAAGATLVFDDGGTGATFNPFGGNLNLSDNSGNAIRGANGTEQFLNSATVTGAGVIANFASFINNGTITAQGANSLVLDVTRSGSLTNNGPLYAGGPDQAGTLAIRNLSAGSTTIQNTGGIYLGSFGTGTRLLLDSGGAANSFQFQSPSGLGAVNMSTPDSAIQGATGAESLVNGAGHTIFGAGTISNLASLTNAGTLWASQGALVISSPLTNWGAATGTLTGGSYQVDAGATLRISGLGSIVNISGAEVTLRGNGLVTGNGTSNALAGLSLVSSTDAGGDASLNLKQNASLTLSSDLDNQATVKNSGEALSTINLNSGTLTLNSLTNSAYDNSPGSGAGTGNPTANVTLSNSAFLQVGGDLTNQTHNGTSSTSASAQFFMDTSSATVAGNLLNYTLTQDSGVGLSGNGGSATVSLNASSLSVGGNASNLVTTNQGFQSSGGFSSMSLTTGSLLNVTGDFTNSVLNAGEASFYGGSAQVYVDNSTLAVGGNASNIVVNNGFESSGGSVAINLTNGAAMTVAGNLSNGVDNLSFSDYRGGSGTLSIDAGSSLIVNGNLSNVVHNDAGDFVEGSDANLYLSQGSTVTVQGFFTNGVLSINGTPNSAGNALLDVSGNSTMNVLGLVDNTNGTIVLNGGGNTLTGHGFINNTGLIAVAAGDLADFQGGAFQNLSGGQLTGGTYVIGGTMRYDSSSGLITSIGASATLVLDAGNGGVASVQSGNANALAALAGNAGNLTLANGAVLHITPGGNAGNPALANGAVHGVTQAGGTFSNSGRLATAGTGVTFNVTGDIFNTSPGVVNLQGSGDLVTASGRFSNSGTLTFAGDNATVTADGGFTNTASGLVTMAGTLDLLSTPGRLANAGAITIGATERVRTGSGVDQSGNLQILSGGKLEVLGGNDFTQTAGITNLAAGVANVSAGATNVSAGGTLTAGTVYLNGGEISGGGTIAANVVNNGGTLNPGNSQRLSILGDYTQLTSGMLILDLTNALSYDRVAIGGNLKADGTLELRLGNGFDAAVGTIFYVMSWNGSWSGHFNYFSTPGLNGATWNFSAIYDQIGRQLELVVVDGATAPEPSTIVLLCAGLPGLALMIRARRRKTGKL